VQLGGLLVLHDDVAARWPWSGTWRYPLGDGTGPADSIAAAATGFRVLRGYTPRSGREEKHLGLDIGDGRAGAPVRACARGLVVCVKRGRRTHGFGDHVVLAHHLREGGLAYSVYAHLKRRSIRVRPGECVEQGETIAAVGQTGRATTPHLHLEVRLCDDPALRWEKARAVDPAEFIEPRLARRADEGPSAPYLEWADRAGLIHAEARGDEPLTWESWQGMLARAARLPLLDLPRSARALRDTLVALGVLPDGQDGRPESRCSWEELARDLERLRHLGTRLPRGPLDAGTHRAALMDRYGTDAPASLPRGPRQRRGDPLLADACMLLADLAGPAREARADGSAAGAKSP